MAAGGAVKGDSFCSVSFRECILICVIVVMAVGSLGALALPSMLFARTRVPTSSLSTAESGTCTYLPEKLVGRCWGLTAVDDALGVTDADACAALCCHMGARCITHQFLAKDKKCFVGKNVRLGKEAGTTPLWCEPRAPEKWIGRKLARATAMDVEEGEAARNKCDWGER